MMLLNGFDTEIKKRWFLKSHLMQNIYKKPFENCINAQYYNDVDIFHK